MYNILRDKTYFCVSKNKNCECDIVLGRTGQWRGKLACFLAAPKRYTPLPNRHTMKRQTVTLHDVMGI
jgi:hypothetical protein